MKKLLFVICLVLVSASSFAQKGKTTIGLHGNYMIDSPNNLGIGANIGYEFINNLRGTAEFNYFFKKDYVSFWNLEANVAYLFRVADGKLILYPLAGVDVLVTGEIKHHEIIAANSLGIDIIDAGHFKSEDIVILPLVNKLSEEFSDIIFTKSQSCDDKIKFI